MNDFNQASNELVREILDAGKRDARVLEEAIKESRMPATKYGLSLTGTVVFIVLVAEVVASLLGLVDEQELVSDVKFIGLIFIAFGLVALGHWMAIDERRAAERIDIRRSEIRRTDLAHIIRMEELNIERKKLETKPTTIPNAAEQGRP